MINSLININFLCLLGDCFFCVLTFGRCDSREVLHRVGGERGLRGGVIARLLRRSDCGGGRPPRPRLRLFGVVGAGIEVRLCDVAR